MGVSDFPSHIYLDFDSQRLLDPSLNAKKPYYREGFSRSYGNDAYSELKRYVELHFRVSYYPNEPEDGYIHVVFSAGQVSWMQC